MEKSKILRELEKIEREALKKTNNILKRCRSQEEVNFHNKGYNIWYLPIKRLIKILKQKGGTQ
jgi:hypothetical protein